MVDNTTPASVRRELNQKLEALPLFKRDRVTALFHFCAALELIPTPLSGNPDLAMAKGRHAVEASTRAIPAIFHNCPVAPVAPRLEINPAVLVEAKELVNFANRYDQIMYCFELADRQQFEVRYDALAQRTVFSYVSLAESAADTLLRTHERDSKMVETSVADQAVATELVTGARRELHRTIVFSAPDAINYPFTLSLLSLMRRLAGVAARVMRWEFPKELRIGNLTFDDVRRFWGALHAIVVIHFNAHMIAAQSQLANIPSGSILLVKSREDWTELIADVGDIGVGAVSELLWWYTFDMKVAESTPPIQPILEIKPGYLAAPMSLITTASVERNLQKILSRHPRLRSFHKRIKDAKEEIALAHLRTLFPVARFAAKPTVIIKGITDVDLLVYERSSGFTLVIQHKWLIAPETVAESSANDDELRKGATQAAQSRDVFRNNGTLVQQVLELPDGQTIDRVEAVVICRGAEPTGFLEKLVVPIALELAFEDLWKQSSGSLAKLWDKLTSRPDHAKAASRYGDTAATITVGGLRFSVPVLSLELKL